jgi:hypothetical protein
MAGERMAVVTIESPAAGLSAEGRAALAAADVIIAVDARTEREFTVFGTPPLESTVSLKRPAAMRVVRVSLDDATGELKRLVELVRELKG